MLGVLLIVLAVLVEYVVEILKDLIPYIEEKVGRIEIARVVAFVVSLILVITLEVDFLEEFGLIENGNIWVGFIISALFISAGAHVIYDFLKNLKDKINGDWGVGR